MDDTSDEEKYIDAADDEVSGFNSSSDFSANKRKKKYKKAMKGLMRDPEEIIPLNSADEISSGEEDGRTLPSNYKFYAERIADAEKILKKLRKMNT